MAERSSHISARVDLVLRLRGDAARDPLIALKGYVPLSVRWSRNRAAEADTCEVELFAGDLPFDLRIIASRGCYMRVWLFEHQRPDACEPGDRGFFEGPIDEIQRDATTSRIAIRARDWTSLFLDTKVGEGQLRKIEVAKAASLTQVVRNLMNLQPGTNEGWEIEELSSSAGRKVGSPTVRPKPAKKGVPVGKKPAGNLQPRFRHMASIMPGQGEVTLWDAITAVCHRVGVVPEVMVGAEGTKKVVLVDAEDLHMSATLRPFRRGEKSHRVLTQGVDLVAQTEQLSLTAHAQRPDFIQVASIDRETGKSVLAEWPQNRKGGQSENGLFQTVDGLTTAKDCEDLARRAWEALSQNEFGLTVAVPHPWSTGGGPDDPDLLDVGFGAAVEIAFAGLDRITASADDFLTRRGLPGEIAGRIAAAQEQVGALALVFLVVSVEHEWSGGSNVGYRCTLTLRQALAEVTP